MAREKQHNQKSVFGEIVDWTLAPLLILWPISMAIQYFLAYNIADDAYDRELRDSVVAISKQLSYTAGQLVVKDDAAARSFCAPTRRTSPTSRCATSAIGCQRRREPATGRLHAGDEPERGVLPRRPPAGAGAPGRVHVRAGARHVRRRPRAGGRDGRQAQPARERDHRRRARRAVPDRSGGAAVRMARPHAWRRAAQCADRSHSPAQAGRPRADRRGGRARGSAAAHRRASTTCWRGSTRACVPSTASWPMPPTRCARRLPA